jgi:hypothetical protein
MDVTLLKQPYEIALTGNAMLYVLAISPYGTLQQGQDIKLQVKVWVEDTYNSGIYTEKKSQVFIPNNNGLVQFDVSSIVAPYIDWYTPKLLLSKPLVLSSHKKRYKISWVLTVDNAISVAATFSNTRLALKGKLAYEAWHTSEFFEVAIVQNKQGLLFNADERFAMNEQRFLYWLYPFADNEPQKVTFFITYEDDSTETWVLNTTGITCDKWAVCVAPIGPQTIAHRAAAANLLIAAYKVHVVCNNGYVVVDMPTIKIEHRNFYNTTQLYYRNSLGALETIRLRGQTDFEADYDRQQAQRIIPPLAFTDVLLQAQTLQTSVYETTKFSAYTGFIKKNAADKLRDIFLTRECYIAEDGNLKPIVVIAKNTKFFSNKDKMYGVQIDYSPAYQNEAYTPKGLMPVTRNCPAVETLVVKQLNKDYLLIMYALPIPYNLCNVQLIISGTTYDYTYIGNTATIRQPFSNPASGSATASITIRARVICDAESDPVDAGAFTSQALTVSGSSTLVAQNDTYSISNGFNTAITLSGSVLVNDSDPDGNPIEVVPVTGGSTTQSGTYSINTAGIISYTPPSSGFSGIDTFTYQLRRVGTTTPTVSATVTVNVGTSSAAVYVAIVERNANGNINSDGSSYYNADMYLEFYSNAFGTIPIDVTGLGLVVDVRKTTNTQDFSGNQYSSSNTTNVTATGTSTYAGSKSNSSVYEPMFSYDQYSQDVFDVLPGAGYVVI